MQLDDSIALNLSRLILVKLEDLMPEDYAAQFMLREYTRIIDAYHDLHRQKDALINFTWRSYRFRCLSLPFF